MDPRVLKKARLAFVKQGKDAEMGKNISYPQRTKMSRGFPQSNKHTTCPHTRKIDRSPLNPTQAREEQSQTSARIGKISGSSAACHLTRG